MIFMGHGEGRVRDTVHGAPVFMSGQPEYPPGFHVVEPDSNTGAALIYNEADIAFNTHITATNLGAEPGK